MAELADALDLGSSAFRRAGSIPVTRTKKIPVGINPTGFIFCCCMSLGFCSRSARGIFQYACQLTISVTIELRY